MRRPGIWVANGIPNDPNKMLSWRPGALTSFFDYLGPNKVSEYKQQHPEVPIIIRLQHPRQWHEEPTYWARWLGEMVASKWPDLRDLDPYVYFCNEVNLHYENGDDNVGNQQHYETPEFYQRYAEWVRMTADVVKQRAPEMKLVTPPFAFGHHEDGAPDDNGNPKDGWAGYDYLADTVRSHFDSILTFHAYWGNASGSVKNWLYDAEESSWYAFRWRRLLNLFQVRYGIRARVIIDEAGNFGASDPDFTDQIEYHARQCLMDERVIGVTYFLWQDPTGHHGNLPNAWVERCGNIEGHIARLAAMEDVVVQPVQPVGPTIRVLMPDGQVQTMLVEEYLRGVVPAEMPSSWPAEALKVQAVAARTYAMFAVDHPRHSPEADICTTTHCQAYNAGRINANTDAAIQMTKGQTLTYDGQMVNAYYSANCGGHTVSNHDAFGGAQQPHLLPVPCTNPGPKNGHGVGMCQWGAHDMAEQGDDYLTILEQYYTGITLSSEPAVDWAVIQACVLDSAGEPVANEKVRLWRDDTGWNRETVTGADGEAQFDRLRPAIYRLEAVDHDVQKEGLNLAPGQTLSVDLTVETPVPPTPPTPVEEEWMMEIERKSGLPILAGTLPEADVVITLQTPVGGTSKKLSGSKPEHGEGGFEFWTPYRGTYTLLFLNQSFDIPLDGRYTFVTFTRVEPEPEPALAGKGSILGVLKDHAGLPQAGYEILLSGDDLSFTVTTDDEGAFRFDSLPSGSFTLRVVGTDLEKPVSSDGTAPITIDLTLPRPPTEEWLMKVTRRPGPSVIAGSLPEAGIALTITPSSGSAIRAISGSKTTYGVGGFEVPAPVVGTYTIQFLDQTFKLPVDAQFTRVTIMRTTLAAGTAVRLVSQPMSRTRAQEWLDHLEENPATQGVFCLEEE